MRCSFNRTFGLLLIIAFSLGLVVQTADAGRKKTPKAPARIHYSANLVGELEPCG